MRINEDAPEDDENDYYQFSSSSSSDSDDPDPKPPKVIQTAAPAAPPTVFNTNADGLRRSTRDRRAVQRPYDDFLQAECLIMDDDFGCVEQVLSLETYFPTLKDNPDRYTFHDA